MRLGVIAAVALASGCTGCASAPRARVDCAKLAERMFAIEECSQLANCALKPSDITDLVNAKVQANESCGLKLPAGEPEADTGPEHRGVQSAKPSHAVT